MTPEPPSHPESHRPPSPSERRSRHKRVTALAFVVSAIVHLLLVAAYPLLFGPPPDSGPPPTARTPTEPRGTEVIRIVEVPDELAAVEAPEEEPEPVVERPEAEAPVEEVGPEAEEIPIDRLDEDERRGLSAAERLREGKGDPRLSRPLPEELTAVSPERLAQLRVLWAIEDMADSAAAAEAAYNAARDWTHTDSEGKKWGVSPGKLHLGDLTLPLPFSFGAPPGSAAAERAARDAEINRAAGAQEAHEVRKERAKEIREREDENREKKKAKAADPDTTGSGG